ncbi:unnamed protein product [Ceratitis capitata]|uniref:(Mediterranean fruit fly) hypothetical protein n=1 Tax=Ceratitis capitata TaxID=7213 RepID=A0A811VCR8_CERCA|nr:unnamed protein product [Ceratitis capitata]
MSERLKKEVEKCKTQSNKNHETGNGSKAWEKVKNKGNVISDDGGGFEGLIGLEVLEDYDAKLVETAKQKRTRKEKRMDRRADAKKRKLDQETKLEDEEIVDQK